MEVSMRNIECDYCHGYGVGLCTGENWLSTPFVLNYGYFHNYDDFIYTYEPETRYYNIFNVFSDEETSFASATEVLDKIESKTSEFKRNYFNKTVLRYLKPSNFRFNIELGDIRDAIKVNNETFNHVHIMMYWKKKQYRIRIACSYISSNQLRINDMSLLYDGPVYDEIQNPFAEIGLSYDKMLITLCVEHYKYTCDLYKYDCFMRMLIHPNRLDGKQYIDGLRFDSGRDEETGLYDRFSVVKTLALHEDIKNRVMELIPVLQFE